MTPLRLQKDLVRAFLRKFDNLILNRWTISRTRPADSSGVKWRSMEVIPNDLVRFWLRCRYPARNLFHVELSILNLIQRENFAPLTSDFFWEKGEVRWRVVSCLAKAPGE